MNQGKISDYLKEAITGEHTASVKYRSYSEIAESEGFHNTAMLFRALEQAEIIHRKNHLQALGGNFSPEAESFEEGNTLANLRDAAKNELYEFKTMYPVFIKAAKKGSAGFSERVAILSMDWAMQVEQTHYNIIREAIKSVKRNKDFIIPNIYVCRVCGNLEVASDRPDRACTVCGHDSVFYIPVSTGQVPDFDIMFVDKFHLQGGELIRQVTFGMNDGVVSIFALLAGVAGAGQPPQTILITLFAATVAGALSMAAGEFISGKSESDYYRHEINQERLEISLVPDIEKEEVLRIYKAKGFSGEMLESVVEHITEDPDLWAREMVIDELGVTDLEQESGFKNAIVIFFAFTGGACFPVLPYLLMFRSSTNPMNIFYIATFVTVAGLFMAGALKKIVTGVNWFKSGMEMLLVGLFAFFVSYLIGSFIPF
ncbi:MAG: VIT1/CCC1 transporter family protein [Spirochaetes bacterium]|nr:VIT1/CCC1 transporter family protein [Spirochaetota bacterium]